jgi:hypothetical protein
VIAVSPTGLALAVRGGQTRLEVIFGVFTDTVQVSVGPPPSE